MSTWNMPPGVTTNDIPGQEDGAEAEAGYVAWAAENGYNTELVIERWLDGWTGRGMAALRAMLTKALSEWELHHGPEIDMAENAARLAGDVDFETWLENQS